MIESLNYNKEPVSNNLKFGLFNINNYYSNPLTNQKRKLFQLDAHIQKSSKKLSISMLFYAELSFKIIDQTERRLI